ncbi:MAG: glycosyltransferase family 39 protein [Rhodospirillaceae bacterium]|nr:glycosyltransferase family 39 protein [Rhodospirillaceae bacterium]
MAAPASDIGAFVARYRLTEGFRPYLLLTLLCLVLYAPGLASLPPMDRDEARFMQATKQMIETGDYVNIRFQEEARNKKPVGAYWLQAAAVKLTSAELTAPWAYRLPSALTTWLAVLTTFFFGRRLFGAPAGLTAGAMLATTLVVAAEAHLAKTDAALLCATTLCLAGLGSVYTEPRKQIGAALLFWSALAAGILIKGPVIVAVAGATGAALCLADRDLKWIWRLYPVAGVALLAALVAPWLLLQSSAGSGFVSASFQEDILPKLVGGQEGHGALPGTHLVLGVVTAWPWSVLAPFAVIAGWRKRAEPAVRFCLAWLAPAWIVFELVPTKLPHYTLPLMPPLMLLIAALLRDLPDLRGLLGGRWGLGWRIAWSWVCIILGVIALVAARRFGDGSVIPATMAAIIMLGAGLYGMTVLGRSGTAQAVLGVGIASFAFYVTVFGAELPRLPRLALSDRIAARAKPLMTEPVIIAGYHEPSAIFLLGTRTILSDAKGAADHLLAHPAALAVVPVAALDLVRETLAAGGRNLVRIEEFGGYNYSRGRPEHLALITTGS